ncbi:hypothetical protein NPIL_641191 [Nephila pilipes]|uniref:Uncharacterized protein n=1 Tax=Nephila pilipes TaxID=299642 RepID=A0A8X6QUJ1_NEPPI|nr:hypothetical protein NPIL_641191 [Nephila pilipes]
MSHEDSAATIKIARVSVRVPPLVGESRDIVQPNGEKIPSSGIMRSHTLHSETLCSQYADSGEQRIHDLISGMLLGDRKPSRLLLEMRSKAGNRMKTYLKSLFL